MKTPWGNARATLRLRGVEPPPRGTLSEKLMIEMVMRERWKELAAWEMAIMANGLFQGIKPEAVKKVIETLHADMARHIFHTMYDTREYMQRVQQKIAEEQAESNRLERLRAMTV